MYKYRLMFVFFISNISKLYIYNVYISDMEGK